MDNEKNRKAINDVLKYIEDHEYEPMNNGVEYNFAHMETLFDSVKHIDNYDVPVEIRMRVTVTQFCNCKHEGSKMYAIHKNWVKKHASDDDSMREQDWIDRVLEQMLDQTWNLKFSPNEGAENYFRQFKTLLEATVLRCCYAAPPPEVCMQKVTCAIMIANLLWKVTNKANLDLWNIMEEIYVEDNTKEKANEEVRDKTGDENNPVSRNKSVNDDRHEHKDKKGNNVMGIGVKTSGTADKNKPKENTNKVVVDKTGDENEDENNPVFNANREDSYDDNSDKDNNKDNIGREGIKALHGWNKECEKCANKKSNKKCEQCQETCHENCVRVPAKKKRGRTSGSKNSNKMKSPTKKKDRKAEDASDEDSKSAAKKKRIELDEEDNEKNINDKVDEEAVAAIPALQEDVTDKNEEEAAKNTAIDIKERVGACPVVPLLTAGRDGAKSRSTRHQRSLWSLPLQASEMYLSVETKPGTLSMAWCIPEVVFRTFLDALKDSAMDKGLAPANIHDVLDTAKHLSRSISLLLEPNTKKAKLDLMRTKAEERYPKLKLPSPSIQDSDQHLAGKNLLHRISGTTERLLDSPDSKQNETITLIIKERNGDHVPNTLMKANSTLASGLAKLKLQPVVLRKDNQDRLVKRRRQIVGQGHKIRLRWAKASRTLPQSLLAVDTADLQARIKTLEAQVISLKEESNTTEGGGGGHDCQILHQKKRIHLPRSCPGHEEFQICRSRSLHGEPWTKVSKEPMMVLSAIPSWISFEGEGSIEGFRYKLQTGLNDVVKTIRQEAAVNISMEGQALAQMCIQDANTFTTGLIQWMCRVYQDLPKTNPLSSKENWRYISHCVWAIFEHLHKTCKVGGKLGVDKLVIMWGCLQGRQAGLEFTQDRFFSHSVMQTVLNEHMHHRAAMRDEMNAHLAFLKKKPEEIIIKEL
eukprot:jgi/Psemu1/32038/gm1.32038_g